MIVGSYFAFQQWGALYFVGVFLFAAVAGLVWTESKGRMNGQSKLNPQSQQTRQQETLTSKKETRTPEHQEPFISDTETLDIIDDDAAFAGNPQEADYSSSKIFTLLLKDPGDNPVAVMRVLQDKLGFTVDQAKQMIVAKQFPVEILSGSKRDVTVKSLLLKQAGARIEVTEQQTQDESTPRMRAIGYWISLISEKDLYPPQDFVGEYDPIIKDLVVEYLECGEIFKTHKGLSWCRFNCGIKDQELGTQELTDGEWVWPEGLAHYVREHNVLLPDEFIDHIKDGGSYGEGPVEPNKEVDFGFWTDWCRQHSSGQGSGLIRKAREHADALGQKGAALLKRYREKRALLIENYIGVSETNCQVNGCKRQALQGTTFCAEHHMNPFAGQAGFKPDAEFFELSKKHKQFHDALEKFTNLKYVLNRPAP